MTSQNSWSPKIFHTKRHKNHSLSQQFGTSSFPVRQTKTKTNKKLIFLPYFISQTHNIFFRWGGTPQPKLVKNLFKATRNANQFSPRSKVIRPNISKSFDRQSLVWGNDCLIYPQFQSKEFFWFPVSYLTFWINVSERVTQD